MLFFQEVESLISYAECMTVSVNNQCYKEDMSTNCKGEIGTTVHPQDSYMGEQTTEHDISWSTGPL